MVLSYYFKKSCHHTEQTQASYVQRRCTISTRCHWCFQAVLCCRCLWSFSHWKSFQSGVVSTTTSILNQQAFYLEGQYEFLLTSRFNQDCLETLFSTVRIKQPVPNTLQFKNNLKLVSLAQFLKSPENSRYNIDDDEYMSGFIAEHEKEQFKKNTTNVPLKITLPPNWDKSAYQHLNNAGSSTFNHYCSPLWP